jgi:transmembrane sensor
MDYTGYTAKDFALDDDFIDWVRNPNAQTRVFWEDWMGRHPHQKDAIEEARQMVLLFHFREDQPTLRETNEVWNAIERATHQEERHPAVRPPEPVVQAARRFSWSRMAATVSLLLLAGVALYQWLPEIRQWLPAAMETSVTPRGEQSQMTLPDGTRVWLNAASTLEFPLRFTNRATREVWLKGEAFFDVAHNKQQPFLVHTSGITIKVLGTRFNVKSYGEEVVETTLVEGKVELENPKGEVTRVTLLPNQKATFSKKTTQITLSEVEPALYTSWKEGKLLFKNAPMQEVLQTFSREFNVNIRLANKNINRCTITADFTNESLDRALDLLCKLIEATHEKEGNEIVLNGKGCIR